MFELWEEGVAKVLHPGPERPSGTTAKGSVIKSEDCCDNTGAEAEGGELQLVARSKSSSVATSEEWRTRSDQLGGTVPAFMYGTVEKVSSKTT